MACPAANLPLPLTFAGNSLSWQAKVLLALNGVGFWGCFGGMAFAPGLRVKRKQWYLLIINVLFGDSQWQP
jgi:hypothetical protein